MPRLDRPRPTALAAALAVAAIALFANAVPAAALIGDTPTIRADLSDPNERLIIVELQLNRGIATATGDGRFVLESTLSLYQGGSLLGLADPRPDPILEHKDPSPGGVVLVSDVSGVPSGVGGTVDVQGMVRLVLMDAAGGEHVLDEVAVSAVGLEVGLGAP